jgi:cobalt-zinc-cadmium efflux system protein
MATPEPCCESTADFDAVKTRQLRFAVVLTSVVFVGELIGGLWTGSLALLSDAGHVFSDVLALALSLLAVGLACRPPTERHSYGLHRTEVFAAFLNGVALLGISAVIFYEAYQRLAEPPSIRSGPMLLVAILGLVANGIVALRLGGHEHGDLNLHSAYLHVIGDLLASVAVVVAAVIILATGWLLIDPILSAGIGLLILAGGFRVTREATHILLQGVPRGIDLAEVASALAEVPGVQDVHHVHAWSLCSNILAFSAHVVSCPDNEAERTALRCKLEQILTERFGFSDTTLELECNPTCDGELLQQFTHGMTNNHNHAHNHSHDHDNE